jgi:hypothetical protein
MARPRLVTGRSGKAGLASRGMDVLDWVTGGISVIAVLVSIWAVVDGRRSARSAERQARRSADAAERSADVAQASLDTERRVRWEWKVERGHSHLLTNLGLQAAYDVTVKHPIASMGRNETFRVVEGKRAVRVMFPRVAGAMGREVEVIFRREPGGAFETWRHPF